MIDARWVLCGLALSLSMCAAPPPAPAASPPEPAEPAGAAVQTESASPAMSKRVDDGADEPEESRPPPPSRSAQRADARRELQRAEADLRASANDCATACRALASMSRAVDHLCGLADSGDDRQRCEDAKRRLAEAKERVQRTCGACSG